MALFKSMAGHRRLAGQVYYGPGLVTKAGIHWALGSEIIAIELEMGRAEMEIVFVDLTIKIRDGCGSSTNLFGTLDLVAGQGWCAVWVYYC